MPKKVKILARTVPYKGALLGKNAEYTIDDYTAAKYSAEGKLQILEDLGEDDTSHIRQVKDESFLEKIRQHAPEIMDILEKEFQKKKDQEMESRFNSNESIAETDDSQKSESELSSSDTSGSLETTEGNSTIESNSAVSDEIPTDFPGFNELQKAGITTMTMIKEMGYDDFIEKGIRQGLVNQIGAKKTELGI